MTVTRTCQGVTPALVCAGGVHTRTGPTGYACQVDMVGHLGLDHAIVADIVRGETLVGHEVTV